MMGMMDLELEIWERGMAEDGEAEDGEEIMVVGIQVVVEIVEEVG